MSTFLEDTFKVGELAPKYDAARGKPLYANPLPAHLPKNAVVALVNFHCDYCHSTMVGTGYPRETPDHRPIIYVDLTGEGNPAGPAYAKKLGYHGGGASVTSVIADAIDHPTIHGKPILQPGGQPVGISFPILLNVDAHGQLTNRALSVGVLGTIRAFDTLRGHPLAQQASATALSDAQIKALVDRATFGDLIQRDGKGRYTFTTAELNANHGAPDSHQLEQNIDDDRSSFIEKLKSGDKAELARIEKLAAKAPDAATAARALDTLVKLNGIECGCTVAPPLPPVAVNLDATLGGKPAAKPTAHR